MLKRLDFPTISLGEPAGARDAEVLLSRRATAALSEALPYNPLTPSATTPRREGPAARKPPMTASDFGALAHR